jgi:hypothetical protein
MVRVELVVAALAAADNSLGIGRQVDLPFTYGGMPERVTLDFTAATVTPNPLAMSS